MNICTSIDDSSHPMLLIFQMLDELAVELGYKNGAQDLIGEEPAVNVELLQIVHERLLRVILLHEEEISRSYI
jgi:hypothetical protein